MKRDSGRASGICRQRRGFIKLAGASALSLAAPFGLQALEAPLISKRLTAKPLPLQLGEPDQNGMRLLPGFQSRVIARSGQPLVAASSYTWHDAPDGGATVATADGGWIYVSNSELDNQQGGVGAIRFSATGAIVNAYNILTGTSRNCAGNMTPWFSYLSCEEIERGQVWECDPYANKPAQARPALGHFIHESVVVEPSTQQLYLTEDHPQGCLYRFTPTHQKGHPDLSHGLLEVAQIIRHDKRFALVWHRVPEPMARRRPTRYQVKQSTPFRGGEGICYLQGLIIFATKGDNRIWSYNVKNQVITVLYDDDHYSRPILQGVDNVITTPDGGLLVSEDGGDMQLVTLTLAGQPQLFMQLQGHPHSELTGLAFSPDGRRLYVSSQRGRSGRSSAGMLFEISRSSA